MKTTDATPPQHTPEPVVVPWSPDDWPEDAGPENVGLDAVVTSAYIARGMVNAVMDTLPDLRREEDDEARRLELLYAEGLAGQAWTMCHRLHTTLAALRPKETPVKTSTKTTVGQLLLEARLAGGASALRVLAREVAALPDTNPWPHAEVVALLERGADVLDKAAGS